MKAEIRKLYLNKRRNLTEIEKKEFSDIICNKIIKSLTYRICDTIFAYMPMKYEVDIGKIIETALNDNKTVAIPITYGDRNMEFMRITGDTKFEKTKMGVFEPVGDKTMIVVPSDKSMFIVPGVAFDKTGGRLGYGGGYYDCYFERNTVKHKTAVAFDIQITEKLPLQKFDKRVETIITEKRELGKEL